MNRMKKQISATILVLMLLALSTLPAAAFPLPDTRTADPLTPVVLFPGWGGTRLEVSVHNQTTAPDCPASGTFEYTFFPAVPSTEFTDTCQARLLTLRYDFSPKKGPVAKDDPPWQISEQPGVRVRIISYGKTESSPVYEALYSVLEQAGYRRNVNIRVAGYDLRLTPDMGGFMDRTTGLIEETYRENGNTPVHLVGHSNGPLYIQYLLTHTSQHWKDKYIHGFTPIAGNWPGQGWLYHLLLLGFNVPTASYPADPVNAAASAAMYASHPSTYMSSSDPAYFGNQEVVLRVGPGGKEYTPADAGQLFKDAGLELSEKIGPYYFGFVKFLPPNFPYVDTYAEKGSGLWTVVGVELPDLTVGQLLPEAPVWILRDGDGNQEDITNDAVQVWQSMPCYRFEFHDNPGVDHLSLAMASPDVWGRLLMHLQQPRSVCRLK